MAVDHGLSFNDVKDELALVVGNGLCGTDPRVMAATNDATKVLLDMIIPVGGYATYDVVASGSPATELFLPKELENAIYTEVLGNATVNNQSDVKEGHATLVTNFTYLDPNDIHDNPLDDLGLFPDPGDSTILRRKYNYPGLTPGATVRVTGAKRFIPITNVGHSLIIQNIPALKSAILYREYLTRGAGSIDDANKFKLDALELLKAEVQKHLMDPRRAAKRKAAYQADIIAYAEGTLGRTRARLALEVPGLLMRGKADISYLVNRAVQMLIDNRNQLAIAGRIQIHGEPAELSYLPATTAATVLKITDYNQIRLMMESFMTEGPEPQRVAVAEEFQKRAFELQRAKLIEETEALRHTKYTNDLSNYSSETFGWMVARLALELQNGLALTNKELERLVSFSEKRIMERGVFKGCIKELSATIHGGDILFPRDVEAVLAADICGLPIDIRSILFAYQKNGPGFEYCGCQSMFRDKGEVFFPQNGSKRRKYHYNGATDSDVQMQAVCKYRWVQKTSCDEMVIKNFEAIRLMAQSIQNERHEKWEDARNAAADALDVMDRELIQYLGGIQHVPAVDPDIHGFAGIGEPL